MKSLTVRLSLLSAVLFCVAFLTPAIAWAQDPKPLPESPPSESKPDPPPSPPAESPRNDPPPSPPAESPRNDPPPSPPPAESPRSESPSSRPAETPRSNPAPNSGGSRNNDGPSSRGNNDNRRSDNDRRTSEDGGRVRGTMSGDGSGNRRDRVIETESGDIVAPGRTRTSTPDSAGPGGNNPGGSNPGGSAGSGGGNRGGGRYGRDRDRDGDGGRWRDRHGDRRGHRHYRGDECYQVPTYDDTVSYRAASYPDYDRDDSLDAYELGYNDGLYTGANDGRRGQTFDPERSHFHKRPVGYHSSKGSRADYEQAYRDGFLRGYREGYQNWQKYFAGGRFRRN
ncbi:MAG: hypothetical protein WAM70_10440 [Pyrinomonadaceae bacterium]